MLATFSVPICQCGIGSPLVRIFFIKLLATFLVLSAGCCPKLVKPSEAAQAVNAQSPRAVVHQIAMYLPNRIFDLLDIVRMRARVGPGVSAGVRITKYVQLYLGSYIGIYVGLPGPRGERSLPLPIGIDTLNGLKLSVLDGTAKTCFNPGYTDSELGINATLLILGLDVGFDPLEVWDFASGFIGADFRNDDI